MKKEFEGINEYMKSKAYREKNVRFLAITLNIIERKKD